MLKLNVSITNIENITTIKTQAIATTKKRLEIFEKRTIVYTIVAYTGGKRVFLQVFGLRVGQFGYAIIGTVGRICGRIGMEDFSIQYMIQVMAAVCARILALVLKFLPIILVLVVVIVLYRSWQKKADDRAAREFTRKRSRK